MLLSLILSSLVFIPSIILHFQGREKAALWTLLLAAFVLRMMMIDLDPYLHDWDERFHAAVAKNMMQYPFKPMLRLEALLPYKVEDWCCNHIWLHKQPLFLWQMALSMKVFGIHTLALRLPNVLMGTFMVYCIYRIAKIWTNHSGTAYLAAILSAAAYFPLELCAGMMPLEHNDLMMGGYVTASIWAFCEYTQQRSWKWALLVGIMVGCAVLVKWLTGLLIFGGWGIYLLIRHQNRLQVTAYMHFLAACLLSAVLILPWQIYISNVFPLESAASYAYNYKHIFEDLGHSGTVISHVGYMVKIYSGGLFLGLMMIGMSRTFREKMDRDLSWVMLAMFSVVYGFFSLIVATKIAGLTFPVFAIGMIWIAMGVQFLDQRSRSWRVKIPPIAAKLLLVCCVWGLVLYAMQPTRMANSRKPDDPGRNAKLHNTAIYRQLNDFVAPDEIVLNCKAFEDTEVRFWQPNNAYDWYPSAKRVDSLLSQGYKLVAFKSFNDQRLPEYLEQNPKVRILDLQLK